ncbi:hypothetical protein Tco_1533548 [Tanacetum coccineum]
MTTPRPTPFPATTPRAGVLVPFVIISDSDDEITTLPVRPAPPSSDCIPALSGYPLDYGDDSSDEDLSETAESLRTQTPLTLIVHPPSTRDLPTSPAFAHRPGKEILMPLGYRAAMDRWRAAPPSTFGDDIETLRASLASAMQETMTLHARIRAEYAEQEVRELREFRVTDRLEILELHSQAEYPESRHEQRHDRMTKVRAHKIDMTEQDIETLRARAEAAEQRAETLQVSLGVARMDVGDLIESREAERFEMAELQNKVAENASNKRKWEGDHGGSSSQQQNKKHKVLAKVGTVADRLELPQQLSRVHSTFHVSNLKTCLSDESLKIPLDEIQIDDKLHFIEEPVEIMDREVKQLKQSRIPIVKVRWNSRRGPEFTWKREDQFRNKYPHLFTNITLEGNST